MDISRRGLLESAASAAALGPRKRPTLPPSERRSMNTRPLFTLHLATAPTQNLGAGPRGLRITFPITGGTFEGERLHGKVLAGGDDWTLLRPDGVLEVDLRITLETHDGALVHMTFEGMKHETPAPYFRTLPRFETGDPRYAFLNRLLAVGRGELGAGGPVHVIDEVL